MSKETNNRASEMFKLMIGGWERFLDCSRRRWKPETCQGLFCKKTHKKQVFIRLVRVQWFLSADKPIFLLRCWIFTLIQQHSHFISDFCRTLFRSTNNTVIRHIEQGQSNLEYSQRCGYCGSMGHINFVIIWRNAMSHSLLTMFNSSISVSLIPLSKNAFSYKLL